MSPLGFVSPKNWKRSILRSILIRAYKICYNKELLDKELKRIERKFIEINGYRKWIVNQLKEECKLLNEQYHRNIETYTDNNSVTTTTQMLVLPYKGEKGEKLIKLLNKHVKKVLPGNHLSRNAYCSKKLGSFFNIKDQTKLEHSNDLTYLVKYPENTCSENYLGKTARWINERVLEHVCKDKSHMVQHTLQSGHPSVSLNEFKIVGKGFNNNRVKRKISEASIVKQYRPILNTQKKLNICKTL